MKSSELRSANEPLMSYSVDIVFCIDATYSMTPYLDSAKKTAQDFRVRLGESMEDKGKGVRQLRVRIIEFRDLGVEGPDAIRATPFYSLPEQTEEYAAELSQLVAEGGGPTPESALEALAVAFRSPWERSLDKRRHVVVMCTDAPAHPLGKFALPEPGGQVLSWPTSMEQLQAIWGDETDDGEMEFEAKRLVIFGPSDYPWNEIMDLFENCVWLESAAGHGMADIDMALIIDAVASSL
jgi:hypothetical protein